MAEGAKVMKYVTIVLGRTRMSGKLLENSVGRLDSLVVLPLVNVTLYDVKD